MYGFVDDDVTREYKGPVYKFGQRLRTWRESARLSQAELAKLVGVTQQTVSDWEAGASLPRLSRASRLDEVLGLGEGEAALALVAEARAADHPEDTPDELIAETQAEMRAAALLGKLSLLPESQRAAIEALVDQMLGPAE